MKKLFNGLLELAVFVALNSYFQRVFDSCTAPSVEASIPRSEEISKGPILISETVGKKYSLTYEEGINEIAALTATTSEEDGWVFDGRMWHDIGLPGTGAVKYHIPAFKDILNNSSADTIYEIHNHPSATLPSKSWYAPPSTLDLPSANKMQKIGKQYGKTVISQVVGSEGVWTYTWNDLDDPWFEINPVKDIKTIVDGIRYHRSFHKFFKGENGQQILKERIQDLDFYKDAADLGVYISFQPHKQAIK